MSKGYRDGAFALGLVVGGGLALNLFLWIEYQNQNPTDKSAQTNDGDDYSQIGQWWDSFVRTFVSPSDTLAQWIMAVFTIAAVILVWKTLRSTQKMAADASVSTSAALSAAEASKEANTIIKQEQRPWVLPAGTAHTFLTAPGKTSPIGVAIQAIWKNFGRSPAINAGLQTAYVVVPTGSEIPDFDVYTPTLSTTILGPGDEAQGRECVITNGAFQRFMVRELDLIVYVRFDYASVFGGEESRFQSHATYRVRYGGQRKIDGQMQAHFDAITDGPLNSIT